MTLISGNGIEARQFNGITQVTAQVKSLSEAWGEVRETMQTMPTVGGKLGALFGFGSISDDKLKLQFESWNRIVQSLQDAKKKANATGGIWDDTTIAQTIDGLKDVTEESKEYAKATIRVNEAGELAIPTQKEFGVALKSSAAQAKVATVSTKALAAAQNMIISLGVTAAVMGIMKGIEYLVTADERAIEKAHELKDAYESATSEIESNIKTLEGLHSEFTELSNGVDENAKNISLSADQYDRYKEIVAQIAGISPSLVKGYNDEGVALLDNNSVIAQAIELQKQLNEERQREYFASGEDIIKGNQAEAKDARKEIVPILSTYTEELAMLRDAVNLDPNGEMAKSLETLGIDLNRVNINNLDQLQAIVDRKAEFIALLQESIGLSDSEAQQWSSQIDLLDAQLTKINSINQSAGQFLAQWAALGEGNDAWYGKIDTGLLDEFNQMLVQVASDPSKSYADMQAEVKDLGEALVDIQDKIPVEEFGELKAQLDSGAISQKEYHDAVQPLLEHLDNLAASVPEDGKETVAVLDLIAKGYENYAVNAAAGGKDVAASINKLLSSYSALNTALAEQATGVGITQEAYRALITTDSDYARLLEYTNGTMQINAEEARALADAKAKEAMAILEADDALQKQTYLENAKKIEEYTAALKDKDAAMVDGVKITQETIDSLVAENNQIAETCDSYLFLRDSILQATGAYQDWLNAQNAPESGDMYDDAMEAMKAIQDGLESGKIGTRKYEAAVSFLVPEDIPQEEVQNYLDKLERYLTEGAEGINHFLDDAISEGLMTEAADGFISVVDGIRTEDFVEKLKITPEMAQAIFGELEEYGFEFDTRDEQFQSIGDALYYAQTNADALKQKLEQVSPDSSAYNDILAKLQRANEQVDSLKAKAQEKVSTYIEVDADVTAAQEKVDSLTQQYEAGDVSVGADLTEARQELDALLAQKAELEAPTPLEVQVYAEGLEEAGRSAEEINAILSGAKLLNIDASGANGALDSTQEKISGIADSTGQTYSLTVDTSQAQGALEAVQRYLDNIPDVKNVTVNVTENTSNNRTGQYGSRGSYKAGDNQAWGTARANGNWGTGTAQRALVGELGREIVVDPASGRWRTVGDNGAEFVNLPRNAIVFNHEQTEDLLAQGFVGSRGFSYAQGNAYRYGGGYRPSSNPATSSTYRGDKSQAQVVANIYEQQKKLLEEQKQLMQDQLDALNDQKDLYDSVIRAVSKAIDDEIERLEDMYKAQKEMLEGQLDDMDAALSAVINIIDKEIESLEDAQDALDDEYQPKIDAIQDEIDALEERNKKEKEEIDLQKKKAALDRAKNQKTIRIYREGVGFVWQSDQNAIDDAQQDYNDALTDKQISDLETEKGKLEDALQSEKDKLQESIDSYEEYKNRWQEITDLYEQAQNQQILNMLFGKEFEQDILNQKEEAYIIFRDKYLAIQEELTNVEKEIEANNKRIEELERIKEAWTSTVDAYQEQQDRLNAAQVLGANWEAEILSGRMDKLNSFRDSYISVMDQIARKAEEIEALERRIAAAVSSINSMSGSVGGGSVGSGGGGGGGGGGSATRRRYVIKDYSGNRLGTFSDINAANNYANVLRGKGQSVYVTAETYAKGVLSAPAGPAVVDDGAGKELVIRPARGRSVMFERGTGVIPADITKNLWSMGQNPQRFVQEALAGIVAPGLASPVRPAASEEFRFTFGDIRMYGVNDTGAFADALVKELPAIMIQKLRKN